MRLLLDELYDGRIAAQLRDRGHDAVAVVDRPDLRGSSDARLLEVAAQERRAIVTENAAHFVPLVRDAAARGVGTWGVIVTSPKAFPRSRASVGLFVAALDTLLQQSAGDEALRGQVAWLRPA